VARVYRSLPPDEQRRATLYGNNYGRAGALDFFGANDGLPRATSGHNSYYTWGAPSDLVIAVGGTRDNYSDDFVDVREVARMPSNPYVMPYEDELRIFVLRGLRRPMAEIWPTARHYE